MSMTLASRVQCQTVSDWYRGSVVFECAKSTCPGAQNCQNIAGTWQASAAEDLTPLEITQTGCAFTGHFNGRASKVAHFIAGGKNCNCGMYGVLDRLNPRPGAPNNPCHSLWSVRLDSISNGRQLVLNIFDTDGAPCSGVPAHWHKNIVFDKVVPLDHKEIDCGNIGPHKSQATCPADIQHAVCWCDVQAFWGKANCRCDPGPPPKAPPTNSCSVKAVNYSCDLYGAGVSGLDIGCRADCPPATTPKCQADQCVPGVRWDHSFCYCAPD